jgi:hypothetical protein
MHNFAIHLQFSSFAQPHRKWLLLFFLGGAIGLFLGWSVLSMFTIITDMVRKIAQRF